MPAAKRQVVAVNMDTWLDAEIAQWQSSCFVNSRSWVQIPLSAH